MRDSASNYSIFDSTIDFDPQTEIDAFLKRVPAKWVVYLFTDADDRPVQLLCVKNLRNSLKRRLGGKEVIGPTRRVNYRELVRRIHYRRVDSVFEADLFYYLAARELFPQTYRGMVGFRPAWFIHVDPAAKFPRYQKTIDLSSRPGALVGPLEDKHAAARLIELIEDAFDLCRFYNLLLEYPNANACAYKGMGKCPAPCDGSISIEQYRRLVDWSVQTLIDPQHAVREHTRRMQQAAADLRFETAAKIKQYADQLGELGKGAFRHARKMSDFQFVSLQRGPREGTAKVFLILPGAVHEAAGLIKEPAQASDLLRRLLEMAEHPPEMTTVGAELIGIVSHHLFLAKQTSGVFLRLDAIDDKTLGKAFRDLQKQKIKETGEEDEGLVKELQALSGE
jgi:excinuclease UvrABC nuclease subunit